MQDVVPSSLIRLHIVRFLPMESHFVSVPCTPGKATIYYLGAMDVIDYFPFKSIRFFFSFRGDHNHLLCSQQHLKVSITKAQRLSFLLLFLEKVNALFIPEYSSPIWCFRQSNVQIQNKEVLYRDPKNTAMSDALLASNSVFIRAHQMPISKICCSIIIYQQSVKVLTNSQRSVDLN